MRIRQHITYANVVATIALFGVLAGGGAYASHLISSKDIKDNSIRSKDLKNRKAVKGRDVVPQTLGTRQINERKLSGSQLAPLAATQGACDPNSSAAIECVSTSIRLQASGRLLVTADGSFFSDPGPANLTCRFAVDGQPEGGAVSPGEESADNTSLGATIGFSRTIVTERLPRGTHQVALRCSEDELAGDARASAVTLAVLGVIR